MSADEIVDADQCATTPPEVPELRIVRESDELAEDGQRWYVYPKVASAEEIKTCCMIVEGEGGLVNLGDHE